MPKISDAQISTSNFDGLFVGRPGKGKSIAAASFARLGPTYIYDLDGRIEAVIKFYRSLGLDIEYDTYLPTDFPKFYQKLKSHAQYCDKKVIIIDSYTALADMLIKYSIDLRGGKGSNADKGVIQMTEISDFNAETQGLMNTIMFLRSIKCSVKIMTAHLLLTEHYSLATQKTIIQKSVLTAGKKVSEKVPAYFNNVFYFQTKDNMNASLGPKFVCRTQPEGDDNAKCAYAIPNEIEFTKDGNNKEGSFFWALNNELKKIDQSLC